MSSTTSAGPQRVASNQAVPSSAATAWMWPAIAVVLIAFVALAYTARSVPYFAIDLEITRAVQAVPAPWFHTVMTAVSWPGFPPQVYIFVCLAAIAFYAGHRRREAVYLVVCSVGIATVSQGVKLLVDRPRPSPALVHVLIPGLNGGHWSFPAGHVESYVVVFGFVMFVAFTEWRHNIARGAVMLLGLLMIALIGLSRIDSGEHWFSDVVAGYMLGSMFLTGAIWLFERGWPTAGHGQGARRAEPA